MEFSFLSPKRAEARVWRRSSTLRCHHRFRVPGTNTLLEVTDIREQSRTGGAETESSIFDHRLAAANGGEKIAMVIAMIAVILGRQVTIFHLRPDGVGGGGSHRIVFAIFLQEFFLRGFRESFDGVAGLRFTRRLGNCNAVSDGENSFAADEFETRILAAAVDEVHTQSEIERRVLRGLRVIVEAEQNVGN